MTLLILSDLTLGTMIVSTGPDVPDGYYMNKIQGATALHLGPPCVSPIQILVHNIMTGTLMGLGMEPPISRIRLNAIQTLRRIETPSSRYGITTRLCITENFLTFGSLIFD